MPAPLETAPDGFVDVFGFVDEPVVEGVKPGTACAAALGFVDEAVGVVGIVAGVALVITPALAVGTGTVVVPATGVCGVAPGAMVGMVAAVASGAACGVAVGSGVSAVIA